MNCTRFILAGLATLLINCHQAPDSPATEPAVVANQPQLPWVSYSLADVRTDTMHFAEPEPIAILDDSDLEETSGLAPSQQNPGYLWTHADSGNTNTIFLLSEDGTIVARFIIEGATNRDWEDIAVGPGPVAGQSYIYVADIGDNRLRYSEKIIYRFPEPTLKGRELPFVGRITGADRLSFQLPDGPKNAEAILVDPRSRDLYILSKDEQCVVYKAAYPQSVSTPTRPERVLAIPFRSVTAADFSPDGSELLIRTYTAAFYYTRNQDESVVDALKRPPVFEPLAEEPQGEAITWSAHKAGYYTTSEALNWWTPQVLYFYKRK
ncbi:hypothetical protein [Spirosoma fluminis]